jgi:hypothetical protein
MIMGILEWIGLQAERTKKRKRMIESEAEDRRMCECKE